jgi:hypothetical protein
LPHIDGERRTYSYGSGNYQEGYRLKFGLDKDACFSCHDSTALFGSQTNFRDDNTGMNGHSYHRTVPVVRKENFGPCWDSDWDGIPDLYYMYCQACHNVHGSPSPRMIRHGELISTYDTQDKVPGLDFRYYKADGVTPTTVLSESYYGDMPQIRGPSNTNAGAGNPYWEKYGNLKARGTYYIGFTVCRTCHGLKYGYTDTGNPGYNRLPRYYRVPLDIPMPAGEAVDLIPPTLSSLNPPSGTTGVAVDSPLTFTLSDSGEGVDFSTFSIELTGDKGYSRTYTDEDTLVVFKTGTPESYEVMVFPDVNFGDNETISVTIKVSDQASPPNFMTSPSWYFKTGIVEDWQTPASVYSVSDEDADYPAENLIDDNIATQWRPHYDGVREVVNGRITGKTGWIIFDLGAYYEVHQVRIYGGSEGSYVNISVNGHEVITNLLVDGARWHESEKFRTVGRYLKIYVDHDDPGYLKDSIYEIDFKGTFKSLNGVKSITAYDPDEKERGIQAGDYVVIRFDGSTNAPFINNSNIDNVLKLNNGHTWLDGSGNIGSAEWSTTTYTNDTLTIILSDTGGVPSVKTGDVVTLDGVTILDSENNPVSTSCVIKGSFWDEVLEDAVGYWDFEEGTGNIVYDATKYGNHGIINGATWTAGRSGYALEFDGVDDYVEIGLTTSLDFSGRSEATFAAWIRTTDDTGSIIEQYGGCTSYRFSVSGGRIRFLYEKANCSWEGVSGNVIVNDNEWHYVVAVMDGSKLKLYVDGVLDNEADQTGVIYNADPLYFGRYFAGTDWFNGDIDEVAIYDRALSASEIQERYNLYGP